MAVRTATRNPAVLSYHAMRRAVGFIALSLPVALACGNFLINLLGPAHTLPNPLIERSISDYYHTPMHDYLVGSLCAIAAFLVCSRGYDLTDEVTGYLAGLLTFGVAIFPSVDPGIDMYTPLQVEIGFIHTGFATLMFLVLAFCCIVLFRRSSPHAPITRRKRHRNRIYAACGVTIIACIFLMVALTLDAWVRAMRPSGLLFWCESLALAAFGVAWLTKGEGILRDRPSNHSRGN